MPAKVRDAIRILDADGWEAKVSQEDRRQFKHAALRRRITLSGKLDDELTPRVVESILAAAKLPPDSL